MAKISTPPIPAKMYRHFAIVTVAGTLLLAIFSSGENRQAIADKVAEQQAAAKERREATREKYGTPKLVRAPRQGGGSFDYSDSNAGYGMPTDATGSIVQNVGSFAISQEDCAKGFLVEEAKSDEDPEGPPAKRCLRRKEDGGDKPQQVSPAERQRQIQALLTKTLHNTPGAGAGN